MHHLLLPQISPQLLNQFFKKFSPSTSFLFQPLQSPSYLHCYPVLIINRQSSISREISHRLHFHSLLDLGTSHMVHGAIDTKIAIESLKFDMGHSKSSVPLSLVCLKKRWWPCWQVMLDIQIAMSEKKICIEDVSIVPWKRQIELSNSTPQQPFWMSMDPGLQSQENIISMLPAVSFN